MANVSLKTDFKNGEKLYDEQLNNNFKAIVAALKELNTISWADTPELLTIFRGTEEEVAARPIIDGQLLCDLTNGVMYADFNGKRIFTGGKPGPQGEQGIQGEKGETGDIGPQGEQGIQGEKGETGDSGVYIGSEEPTDPDVNAWVDPQGEPSVEANNLIFSDGETLQEKYDNGDLQGPQGEPGPEGEIKRSILTICRTQLQTIIDTEEHKVEFDAIKFQVGNELSLNEQNDIVIGENINTIRLDLTLITTNPIPSEDLNNGVNFSIKRTSDEGEIEKLTSGLQTYIQDTSTVISNIYTYCNVNPGDTISVYVEFWHVSDNPEWTNVSSVEGNSCLTVEKIS